MSMEFIRPKKAGLSIDMTPMIDIVFQLLIFFMLSSSFLTPALKMNLPKADSKQAPEQQQIIVSIDREGHFFVNQQQVPQEQLREQLSPLVSASEKKAVFVRGDADMPYKYFVAAMDSARKAGATQVNVVHDPKAGA